MPVNPALSLRRPRIETRAEVDPLSPRELEILIASFEGRSRVICVLSGHLGLRPLEVRAVRWASLGDGVLVVGRSMTKKAAQRMRSIAVPAITGQELREWRMRAGRPADNERIVPMTESGLRSWGKQVLRPAIKAATDGRITDGTLYRLRHSHASALHYCNFTVPEAARRMGHGPGLHLSTYAHCMEMGGQRWADLDAMLSAARTDPGVSSAFPRGVGG